MKHLIDLLIPLSLFVATGAQATSQLKVVCDETVANFPVRGVFDSASPILSSKFAAKPERQYLTKDSVCGQPMDFANNCRAEIKTYQGDIGYFFECNNGIKGEVVSSADQLTFWCSGSGVQEDFKHLIRYGCIGYQY